MSAKSFAAIDLGSLTVRLAIAEYFGPGRFRVVRHSREVTGLGAGLAQTGALAPEARARTLEALGGFARLLANQRVQNYRAVGTQALRQAANRDDFLRQVQEELNLRVEVLSPEGEARLSLAGVRSVLAPRFLKEPLLVFDVGGGSSEFALAQPGQEPRFASLPLGALTLSQAQPLGDPPEPARVAVMAEVVERQLAEFCEKTRWLQTRNPLRLVGTAGAVTTLAAMSLKLREYDPDKINNLVLTRDQVQALAQLLARLPEAARAELPGMEPAKAGVMVAGAWIVLTIMKVWRRYSLVVIDAGLLEGVLQEMSLGFQV